MDPPGNGPSLDEELPQPRRRTKRARMLRLDLGVAAVLLAGVAIIAGRATHDGHAPALATSGSPVASGSQVASGTPVTTTSGTWVPLAVPRSGNLEELARCPQGSECITAPIAPIPVSDALQAAFPGARITFARTVRLYVRNFGQALWSLRVDAQVGDAQVQLRLRGSTPVDKRREDRLLFGGHSITRFEDALIQYHVQVEVIAPPDQPAAFETLRQLAGDVRLLQP
jgi:hypothetical protein